MDMAGRGNEWKGKGVGEVGRLQFWTNGVSNIISISNVKLAPKKFYINGVRSIIKC